MECKHCGAIHFTRVNRRSTDFEITGAAVYLCTECGRERVIYRFSDLLAKR
ncbi:hypothetical protein [Photobacterium swingsii]|uniref:hypothetical protein n=1 Tax=Photobacterium swingsii TaxID=680026 RepID=UPI000A9CE7E9|nr:hypothetical protein [Photobacterium swingsii]